MYPPPKQIQCLIPRSVVHVFPYCLCMFWFELLFAVFCFLRPLYQGSYSPYRFAFGNLSQTGSASTYGFD